MDSLLTKIHRKHFIQGDSKVEATIPFFDVLQKYIHILRCVLSFSECLHGPYFVLSKEPPTYPFQYDGLFNRENEGSSSFIVHRPSLLIFS